MTNLTLEKLPQAVSQLFDRLDTIENLILNKNNQTDSDQLLTIQQASELTKLSVPTLYGYVSRQEIPFSKRPNSKRLWFSKRELIAWLSEGQTKTVEVINQEANLFLKKTNHKMENNINAPLKGKHIYTYAQSSTTNIQTDTKVVQGIGSDLNNTDAINGRARKKSISNAVTLGIIDAVKDKGETQRLQTYWNTYYCQSTVTTANGKLYGNYCKNRHCTLCASIRKAEIINQYLPIIEKWSEPYFVTLTSKSVPAYLLNRNIKGCFRAFRKIKERFRKRFERGKIDFKLMGIKSLECNFNPKLKTYNPHFHIIVPDKKTAEALIQEWMKIWTPKHTGIGGQHMVKITNPAKCMVEVIKYGSKIFTEPDPRNKSKKNKVRDIYVVALDNIYKAMKGKRIFERFGFNLGENKKKRKPKTSALTKFETWTFEAQTGNWINNKNGNSLSSYVIPHDLEDLLKNNINLDLE